MPITGERWAPLCFGHISTTKCKYCLPASREFRCSQNKKVIDSTNRENGGPFKLHNTHLLMKEIASLLMHYHAQVPIKKKAKIYMLEGSHFAELENL